MYKKHLIRATLLVVFSIMYIFVQTTSIVVTSININNIEITYKEIIGVISLVLIFITFSSKQFSLSFNFKRNILQSYIILFSHLFTVTILLTITLYNREIGLVLPLAIIITEVITYLLTINIISNYDINLFTSKRVLIKKIFFTLMILFICLKPILLVIDIPLQILFASLYLGICIFILMSIFEVYINNKKVGVK